MGYNANNVRDPKSWRQINVRLDEHAHEHLKTLCKVNRRAQWEIVQTLIEKAFEKLQDNPHARINP